MQPISIVGPGAADLAGSLADRLDGRVAVVDCGETADGGGDPPDQTADSEATDGGVAAGQRGSDGSGGGPATTADTSIALEAGGSWSGRGSVDGLDDLLDGLAPDHDYLVAVDESRLRLPTVLLGERTAESDVPGPVIAAADAPAAVDVEALLAEVDAAEPWITRETLVDRMTDGTDADRAGAVATFTGRVRARDAPDDDRTTHLAFEKYEGVAAERMEFIAAELTEREGVFDVRMHHRTGVIEAGEDIVFVTALAGHRREAFRAVEDGIDRLKDEVPIFKKETTEAAEFWVHRQE
jgi:molybdopterin synthase catalytic subunit